MGFCNTVTDLQIPYKDRNTLTKLASNNLSKELCTVELVSVIKLEMTSVFLAKYVIMTDIL
jgi:hypothetical protein